MPVILLAFRDSAAGSPFPFLFESFWRLESKLNFATLPLSVLSLAQATIVVSKKTFRRRS